MRDSACPVARPDLTLSAAADAAVQCLAVGPAEDVLVLFNEDQRVIAESLAVAAEGAARSVQLLCYPPLMRDGEEPPTPVAAAMCEAR
jgi:hypothetical protein